MGRLQEQSSKLDSTGCALVGSKGQPSVGSALQVQMRRTGRQRLAWSSVASETVEQARLYRLRAGSRARARRYAGSDSNAGHGPALPWGTDQYLPSKAKIGLRCFHAPAVKSGNSSVWKLLAIDCSDSGVIALQVTAS